MSVGMESWRVSRDGQGKSILIGGKVAMDRTTGKMVAMDRTTGGKVEMDRTFCGLNGG